MNSNKPKESTKPIDVSLLTNEQLRPWTIDINLDGKIKNGIGMLEKTVKLCSPQKNAGFRGYSILDDKTDDIIETEKTVELHKTQRIHPVNTTISINATDGETVSKVKTPINSNSRVPTPPEHQTFYQSSEEKDDIELEEYIGAIQRNIYQVSRKNRQVKTPAVPNRVHYHENPIPAVLNVGTRDFKRLKETLPIVSAKTQYLSHFKSRSDIHESDYPLGPREKSTSSFTNDLLTSPHARNRANILAKAHQAQHQQLVKAHK